jgi:hypothetical protein
MFVLYPMAASRPALLTLLLAVIVAACGGGSGQEGLPGY